MTNNTINKVFGVETILLDDRKILKLIETWHVPDLRKDLMSLWMLHSNRYKFSSSDGVIEGFKEGHVTLEERSNMYVNPQPSVHMYGLDIWQVHAGDI